MANEPVLSPLPWWKRFALWWGPEVVKWGAAVILIVLAGACALWGVQRYGDARASEAEKEATYHAHEKAWQATTDSLLARDSAGRAITARLLARSDSTARAALAVVRRANTATARADSTLTPTVLAALPDSVRRAIESLERQVADLAASNSDLAQVNLELTLRIDTLQTENELALSQLKVANRLLTELHQIKTPRCGVGCVAGKVGRGALLVLGGVVIGAVIR